MQICKIYFEYVLCSILSRLHFYYFKFQSLKLNLFYRFYSPTAGVGFCPLLNALDELSMKTSANDYNFKNQKLDFFL